MRVNMWCINYILEAEFRFKKYTDVISSYSDFFTVLNVLKSCFCHLQLIPLFFFIGGGTTMSLLYLARLGLRNPDVW